ncbi:MAG: metallophosphoesterase [Alphaproteobacteria bacterium]|nr:metallophosphoesterase [Alphaproteobacteria bacterium]
MRVAVLSDLHFGDEDRCAIATAARFVGAYRPEAILMAGDLSMYGRRRELEAAADWLQSLGAPIVCTPGNHDTPFWDIVARARAPFARYAGFVGGFATGALVRPSFAACAVTTARGMQLRRNWALGSIDLREIHDAATLLARAAPYGVRLIVAHHPFVTPDASPLSGRTRRGERAMRLCVEAGVDVIVTGHLHMPFVEAAPYGDGLTYATGCGTLSERLRGTPPSMLTLDSDGDWLAATCIDCSGAEPSPRWTKRRKLRPRRSS